MAVALAVAVAVAEVVVAVAEEFFQDAFEIDARRALDAEGACDLALADLGGRRAGGFGGGLFARDEGEDVLARRHRPSGALAA